MDKLEQARNEFVRLKNELIENGENTMFEQGRISAFEDATLFINSLQVKEEPVSEDLDKDDSFDELLQKLYIKYNKEVSIEKLLDIASNFVKWQKQKDLDAALGGDALWVEHCNGYHEGQADMKEKVKMVKEWFKDIAEMCERLTSGNVSHQGKTIRSLANRSAEFIDSDIL